MPASFIPSILDELDDVGITSPASGQVIRYDGTKWGNAQLAHGDLSGIGVNTHAQIDSHISSIHVNSFNGRTGAVVPALNDYTWTQIDKAISSLADITTKSHTLLTDIGTNNHAQIDTHISSNHVNSFNGRTGVVLPIEGDYGLDLLSDVVITSPVAGQVLRRGATNWSNSQLAHSDLNLDQTHVNSFNTRTGAVVPAINDYTWAQIDKAISNLADITTKSHSSLTDGAIGGGNTHAQIDTHLASTTNPHGTLLTQQDLYVTGSIGIGIAPSATEILKLQGTLQDNVIMFLVSGNDKGSTLDLRGRVSDGTDVRVMISATRVGDGRIGVITNHPLLISTNNLERMRISAGGKVGIGITNPTAMLHLPAGSATANTAPIKLTSGVNLTTPEAGAMEFDGSDLFFTPSSTRYGIISHITSSSSPHGASLTQQNLTITGAFDISNTAPAITLTDTTASAKSLKIDVDNNIAQIRESAGASNSLMALDLTNLSVGFGVAPTANERVFVKRSFASGADWQYALHAEQEWTGSNANGNKIGVYGSSYTGSSATVGTLYGLKFDAYVLGTSTATKVVGTSPNATNFGSGTVTSALDVELFSPSNVTNAFGIRCARITGGSTRNYGFYYGTASLGSEPTGNYAIYADSDNSYFGAKVGMGVTPTAVLHLKAGTASANTAPLKLTSGTNMTTAEDGAFEYDGTNLYFTVGSTRKTVTLV